MISKKLLFVAPLTFAFDQEKILNHALKAKDTRLEILKQYFFIDKKDV